MVVAAVIFFIVSGRVESREAPVLLSKTSESSKP